MVKSTEQERKEVLCDNVFVWKDTTAFDLTLLKNSVCRVIKVYLTVLAPCTSVCLEVSE